jgi:hypothetical protein
MVVVYFILSLYFITGVYFIGRLLYYIPLKPSGWLMLPWFLVLWPITAWAMEPQVRQIKYWRWVDKIMTNAGWKKT